MTDALLITNPASGSSNEMSPQDLLEQLEGLGRVEVLEPSSKDASADEVRSAAADKDLVIVAGGDGSLHHTVNTLAEQLEDITFGLIPMGTGNDLAGSLGLPEDPDDAARSIHNYGERRIDVGRASGPGFERLFLNASIGGFPVEADNAIDEKTKKRLGPLAFWLGGIKAATNLKDWSVTLNGVGVADCVAVGVGNGITCGGGIPVWPKARLDDGLLEACALSASNLAAALRLGANVKAGNHPDLDEVVYFSAAEIEISASPAVEFNLDGELLGLETPARFDIAASLRIRAPSPG